MPLLGKKKPVSDDAKVGRLTALIIAANYRTDVRRFEATPHIVLCLKYDGTMIEKLYDWSLVSENLTCKEAIDQVLGPEPELRRQRSQRWHDMRDIAFNRKLSDTRPIEQIKEKTSGDSTSAQDKEKGKTR